MGADNGIRTRDLVLTKLPCVFLCDFASFDKRLYNAVFSYLAFMGFYGLLFILAELNGK